MKKTIVNALAILLVLLHSHPRNNVLNVIADTFNLTDAQFYMLSDGTLIVTILLAIILLLKISGKSFFSFQFKWKYIGYIVLTLFINFVWTIISNTYFVRTVNSKMIESNYQEIVGTWDLIWFAIVLIVLSPIVEELLYRGIIITVLSKYSSFNIDLIISAGIFAIGHMAIYDFSGTDFIKYFIPGLVYGLYFKKTDSIYWTILAHMSWNGLVYLLGTMSG